MPITERIPETRSCTRCGSEFVSLIGEPLCLGCRYPRVQREDTRRRSLSPREGQLVALIQQGKANRRIAEELGLTSDTVKGYLSRIYKKWGVTSRTELAVAAKMHALTSTRREDFCG